MRDIFAWCASAFTFQSVSGRWWIVAERGAYARVSKGHREPEMFSFGRGKVSADRFDEQDVRKSGDDAVRTRTIDIRFSRQEIEGSFGARFLRPACARVDESPEAARQGEWVAGAFLEVEATTDKNGLRAATSGSQNVPLQLREFKTDMRVKSFADPELRF
ncbi:MAG TPA: hypothetical protein VJT32_16180 [bacterium]|nr:hypothetical protein [bacterium]